jgi:Kdo2-lipid IVA lauroyltransferase/acyltransferase
MNQNVASVNNPLFLSLFYIFSSIVPRFMHRGFIETVGCLFPFTMKETGNLIRKNLEVIGGGVFTENDIRSLELKTFKNYGRYLLDYMAMHRIAEHNKHHYIMQQEIGLENLDAALSMGKGVILVTPHFGNWELGGIILSLKKYSLNIVTLKDDNQTINNFRERIRNKNNITSIYVTGDSIHTAINIIKALRNNSIVAMLGDRDGSTKTVEVNFFGKKTKFPLGVAYVALSSEAVVLPVFVVLRANGKYQGIIEKPLLFSQYKESNRNDAIRKAVQDIACIFEQYIREYPDQWFNFYPFWS